MKKKTFLIFAAAAILCSCGNKKTDDSNNVIQVRTALVQQAGNSNTMTYPGTIEEESGTDLSFANAGTIQTLNISDGQSVAAGQILGSLDPSTVNNSITMAQSATQQAKETLKQAEDAYKRMKALHDKGSISEIQWVEIQTKTSNARLLLKQAEAAESIARKSKNDTRLVAPFRGYITQKSADVGQNVLPTVSVARLVKIDKVKVTLSVPEDEISKIRNGQQVNFTVGSLDGKVFTGTIREKGVTADPISRCYKVQAVIPNSSHELLPGMICDASVVKNGDPKHITLPANIIQIDVDNKPFVWTVAGGAAHKKFVTLGDNIGNMVVIESGLSATDKVITEGQQKVSEGTQVKEIK